MPHSLRNRYEIKEGKNEGPVETPLGMQRLPSLNLIWSPTQIIVSCLITALMIPMGTFWVATRADLWETAVQYGNNEDCKIKTQNQGKHCTIPFTIDKDLPGPVFVYYELDGFYQNRREYVSSLDQEQLMGYKIASTMPSCSPYNTKDGKNINPCGVTANTLFNDIFKVVGEGPEMIETGIAWGSDMKRKFNQPHDFATSEYA